MARILYSALSDIRAGVRLRRVWLALAREDVGDQHRRTTLGPLWLVLNYFAFTATFVFLFNGKGQQGGSEYAEYVAVGLLVWFYLMELIIQSLSLFFVSVSFIQGTTLPITVYVLRLAMQSIIRSGYAALGCLAILLLAGTSFSFGSLYSLLGVALIILASPAIIVIFAFLGAYLPDSQFVVSNVMRIGMFLTPIFWTYDGSGGIQHAFYWWNPFTYFLNIVREPIIAQAFPMRSFALCVLFGGLSWVLALWVLGRCRKEVVFVL